MRQALTQGEEGINVDTKPALERAAKRAGVTPAALAMAANGHSLWREHSMN